MNYKSTDLDIDGPIQEGGILSDRIKTVPRLLYGTAFKGAQTVALVTHALKTGLRGIDTAAVTRAYQEKLVGEAVRNLGGEGLIRREDIWVNMFFQFSMT